MKKKFNTFSSFILHDEKIVMKVLLTLAMWGGNILFFLLVLALFASKIYEIAIILGVISLFGWWQVIKFYRLGGTKTMPNMSADSVVWKQEIGKTKNEKRRDNNEKSKKDNK